MGKPGHRHGWSPAREGTWGTETSKYPEEEKETSISKVAASEMERAQTRMRASWGSDCDVGLCRTGERPGKAGQRG